MQTYKYDNKRRQNSNVWMTPLISCDVNYQPVPTLKWIFSIWHRVIDLAICIWRAHYPTVRQQGFSLPRQQWSLLNHFRTEQGHCSACRRKWRLTDTDLCHRGETQTMSHIVESCPLTKLSGGLSRLHAADEDTVSWPTSYGSWNAYEKKITELQH